MYLSCLNLLRYETAHSGEFGWKSNARRIINLVHFAADRLGNLGVSPDEHMILV